MTGEVFKIIHWYCARLTPSRNTAIRRHLREIQLLEVVVFAIQFFFSPKYPPSQRSESNSIGDWLIQSKKDGKDQELIQSSTTPDPG